MKKAQHSSITCQHVEVCSNKNHRVAKIGRNTWNLPGLMKTQEHLLTYVFSVTFLPLDISGNPWESRPFQEL